MRRSRSLGILCALVLAAGCGTTVRNAPTSTSVGDGSLTTGASGSPWAPTSVGAGGATTSTPRTAMAGAAPAQAGSHVAAAAVGQVGTTTAVGQVGSAPQLDALTGMPGVTPTTIKIGLELAGNAPATRKAFGLPDPPGPDPKQGFQELVSYINKHGGIAHRRLSLDVTETDLTEGSFESQAQAVCSKFTEDDHVYAVISSVARTSTLFDCLAQHKTIGLPYYIGLAFSPTQWSRDADYLYAPGYVSDERAGVLVDSWVRSKLITKSSRIGLISVDDPAHQLFSAAVRDRLRFYGMTVTDEYKASPAKDISGVGVASQQMSNAVLKFRTENIDRVLFANTAGGGPFFFMPAAENQHYYPKYGISTYEFLRTLVTAAPKAAMARSYGPGWAPAYDLTDARFLPKNALRARCSKIFTDAGEDVSGDAQLTIGGACEPFWLLRDVLARVVSGESPDFRSAFETLGSYPTPYSDPLRFVPRARHEGIDTYRQLSFDSRYGCYKYVSGSFLVRRAS